MTVDAISNAQPGVGAVDGKDNVEEEEVQVQQSKGTLASSVDNVMLLTAALLTRVKENSPSVVVQGIEKLEVTAQPVVKVVHDRVAEPIVTRLDANIDAARSKVEANVSAARTKVEANVNAAKETVSAARNRVEANVTAAKEKVSAARQKITDTAKAMHEHLDHDKDGSVTYADVGNLVHDTLDFQEDGVVSLGDFVHVGQKAANHVKGRVSEKVEKVQSSVTAVTDGVKDTTNNYWQSLMWMTKNTFDRLPFLGITEAEREAAKAAAALAGKEGEGQEEEEEFSLSSVSSHVANRINHKAQEGMSGVRQFSKERLASIIHVDLIAYAEAVIDKTKESTQPAFKQTRDRLDHALKRLQDSVDAIKESKVATKADKARTVVTSYSAELRLRLALALRAATVIRDHGTQYLLGRQLTKLPSDLQQLLLHTVGLGEKDQKDFNEWDTKLHELVTSLMEVLLWREWKSEEMIKLEQERALKQKQHAALEAGEAPQDELATLYAVRLTVLRARDLPGSPASGEGADDEEDIDNAPAPARCYVVVNLNEPSTQPEAFTTTSSPTNPDGVCEWDVSCTFQSSSQPATALLVLKDETDGSVLGEVEVDLSSYFSAEKRGKAFKSWRKLRSQPRGKAHLQIQLQCTSVNNF